jgi:hypothetical protein
MKVWSVRRLSGPDWGRLVRRRGRSLTHGICVETANSPARGLVALSGVLMDCAAGGARAHVVDDGASGEVIVSGSPGWGYFTSSGKIADVSRLKAGR